VGGDENTNATDTRYILNVLVDVASELYWMNFSAVNRGHSIPHSLEIVVQDDELQG
jgi:hypothetical protein